MQGVSPSFLTAVIPRAIVGMADRPYSTISGDTPYAVANFTALPSTSDDDIREPRAPYMMASSAAPFTSDSPRESYLNATPNDSGTLLANKHEGFEDPILPTTTTSSKSKRRPVVLALLLLVALALVIIAVIVPVYFTVIKPKLNQSIKSNSPSNGGGSNPKPGSPGSPGGSNPSPGSNAITGGDGSTINAADGTTFIYHNAFGGFCKFFADFAQLENVGIRTVLVNRMTITDHISSRG
jgi:glucan 1,3-beta-glucosidase